MTGTDVAMGVCMGEQGVTARHVGMAISCCVQCGIPVAMVISTPGIFYPVMAQDLGVQTAQVSAWMSVAMLSCAVFSPIVGNLLGRFRLKAMRVLAVALAGAVMLLFSVATAPWVLWIAAVPLGFSLVLLTALGPATLVNRWFEKRVGTLMGVYAAFTAIGGVVFLMVGQAIIDVSGWRAAYLAFAVITWVVGLPVELLLCRESPRGCGLLPYGAPLEAAGEAGGRPAVGALAVGDAAAVGHAGRPDAAGGHGADEHGGEGKPAIEEGESALRQANLAMRSAPFWLLIACGFMMNLVSQINGFFPKYVMFVDEQAALGVVSGAFVAGAVLSSACQAGSAVGKIGLGVFSDFSVSRACVVLAACGAAGVAGVWLAASSPLLVVGGFAFGFFIAGVLVLLPMLCRQIFGTGDVYPIIYSRVAMAPTFGGAVGNVLWPSLADGAGGFDAVFGCAILLIAAVLACAMAVLRGRHASGDVQSGSPV